MKVVFSKAGRIVVDGVDRGRWENGSSMVTVVMDEPIFPHRRMGKHGFDRMKFFHTHREAKASIARKLQAES